MGRGLPLGRWAGWAALCLGIAGSAPAWAAAPSAEVRSRPLSDAERAAVSLAVEYLSGGAAAWWDDLAADAPLREAGREAALAEIEVRAGPPQGARWELQTAPAATAESTVLFHLEFPSGVDDFLELALVREAEGFKIRSLRVAAEPSSQGGAAAVSKGPPVAAAGDAAPPSWQVWGAGAVALLCALGSLFLRRRRGLAFALAGAAGVLLAATGFLASGRTIPGLGGGARAGEAAAAEEAGLRSLLPLRRALTQAEGEVPAVPAAERGPSAPVARIWQAQHRLALGDLPAAEKLLTGLPGPSARPAAELIRARLHLVRLAEVETGVSYQRALAAAGPWEALLREAATAFSLLGFDRHAGEYLDELVALGARGAEAYYGNCERAVIDDRLLEARNLFLAGWKLEPLPRAELLDWPALAYLLADPALREKVRLEAIEEPVEACTEASRGILALPAGAVARTVGEGLLLEVGGAELDVPGGCSLAPAGTRAVDAAAVQRGREAQALARLPELSAAANRAGALAQPGVRQKAEEAAEALSRRGRWEDLVALTEGLSRPDAVLPSDLTRLRAIALSRLERKAAARDLLIRLSKRNRDEGRADPAALYLLADLLAREGSYDPAMKLVAKANSLLPFEVGAERLRQLQMEKRLVEDAKSRTSPHFTVSYPSDREPEFAAKALSVLEAERKRLSRWIPLPAGGPRVGVDLLPFGDFEVGWSQGGEVIGLFDGRIRLPLGSVRRWPPVVVSVLTHELAHAMIAQKTGGRAPHWFQEGLAQHVEMKESEINSIEGYKVKGTLLAFPLIDPVLSGFSSPAWVSVAYDEARWAVRYIEMRWGVGGIHRLLDAFRAGQTTEEALRSALGVTPAEFDRGLWAWCLREAPTSWEGQVVRYDVEN